MISKPVLMDSLGIYGCLSWENEAKFFLDTLMITDPSEILETGFFAGSSAFMWLALSQAKLTSVDPMCNLYDTNEKHTGCIENVKKLQEAFPNRFSFIQKDSSLIRPDLIGKKFDLMFIDGDHWEKGITNDFQLALDLDIPWILVDDFVTSVLEVYNLKFSRNFLPVRRYNRNAIFMGAPIPIILLKNIKRKYLDYI